VLSSILAGMSTPHDSPATSFVSLNTFGLIDESHDLDSRTTIRILNFILRKMGSPDLRRVLEGVEDPFLPIPASNSDHTESDPGSSPVDTEPDHFAPPSVPDQPTTTPHSLPPEVPASASRTQPVSDLEAPVGNFLARTDLIGKKILPRPEDSPPGHITPLSPAPRSPAFPAHRKKQAPGPHPQPFTPDLYAFRSELQNDFSRQLEVQLTALEKRLNNNLSKEIAEMSAKVAAQVSSDMEKSTMGKRIREMWGTIMQGKSGATAPP